MRKYLPFLVITLFLSQSCIMGQNKSSVLENGKIDPKVKTAIAALDKQVYNSMCENNYDALSHLFSDTLRAEMTDDFQKKFLPQMQRVMKGKNFKIFDEFYIKSEKPNDTVNISSGKGDNAWTMKLTSPSNETYLAMLVAGDSINEVMLTLTYMHNKGKWELSGIRGEDYSLNGRNAIEQYHYSLILQKKGDLMDAVNIMALANHCMSPGGRSFKYKKEEELKSYTDTINNQTKAKYPFPFTITEVKSKPQVVNIHYEVFKTRFVPLIIYQTTINVADTIALKQENDEIQHKICATFYGMDRNNKDILYRAYNDLPNGQNNPRYYGYIQTIN